MEVSSLVECIFFIEVKGHWMVRSYFLKEQTRSDD
jgi:hypothetical protein